MVCYVTVDRRILSSFIKATTVSVSAQVPVSNDVQKLVAQYPNSAT